MLIDHLDHLVLTTIDLAACEDFYTRVLGMRLETFGAGRKALRYGNQKINLHERGHEFEPKAHLPVPGALDLCFIAREPLDQVIAHLQREGCRSSKARWLAPGPPDRFARSMSAIPTSPDRIAEYPT